MTEEGRSLLSIGFDAHMLGTAETGNESYATGVMQGMSQLDLKQRIIGFVLSAHQPTARQYEAPRLKIDTVWPENALIRIPFSWPYLVRRHNLDVFVGQYIVPPLSPCPTIVVVHDLSFHYFPSHFDRRTRLILSTLVPLSMRRAQRVIAPSQFTKQGMMDVYKIPESKISVIPLAISEDFRQPTQAQINHSRFSLEKPYILAVGNLHPRKNLERLLKAFAMIVKEQTLDIDLALVGQDYNAHAASLVALAEAEGISQRIHWLGYVSREELRTLYACATVFAYPSLLEGFGIPPLEAMACRVPVVASNSSSLPEVVSEAGLLCDPYDAQAIADALIRAITDQALRIRLIRDGLAWQRRFSWRQHASEILQLAESLYPDRM